MKKVILVLLIMILLSGCSANVNFEFKEDKIDSSITSDFTISDYYNYSNTGEDDLLTDEQKEKDFLGYKESLIIPAFKDNMENKYIELVFDSSNYNYNVDYRYQYNYNNFKNNYIFNCFDNFEYSEDDNFYNIKLTGKYNCTAGFKLNISSVKGISNSNSTDINDNIHSFDVNEDNNNIVFSINKEEVTSTNILSTIRVIVFVLLIGMSSLTLYYIIKNK